MIKFALSFLLIAAFAFNLFGDCVRCLKGGDIGMLLNRFSGSLKEKSENIILVKRLTSKEVLNLRLWRNLDDKVSQTGNLILFFEVLDSTRKSSRYVFLPVRMGMTQPGGDNRGLLFYAKEGEEWILITKHKSQLGDGLSGIELVDQANGVLKAIDNWLKVDGRKFFDDLKLLSEDFSSGNHLDKGKLQTGLGMSLMKFMEDKVLQEVTIP